MTFTSISLQSRCSAALLATACCLLVPVSLPAFGDQLALRFAADLARLSGETIQVKAISPLADGGLAVLAVSPENRSTPPRVLRISGIGALAGKQILFGFSHHVMGMSIDDASTITLVDRTASVPSGSRAAFRTITEGGAASTKAHAESGVAAFFTRHGDIFYMTTDGAVWKAGERSPRLALIADKAEFQQHLILPSAVSFFPLPGERVGAVAKTSATLYVGSLERGTSERVTMACPELARAKQTYALIAAQAKQHLPEGKHFANPAPALASTADEEGRIYTLVSPYSLKTGATVVQSDTDGRQAASLRFPLTVFPDARFGPSFLAVRQGTLYVAAPDGKVAAFALRGETR